jgi:AcrR family transcriptional regulator
MPSPPKRPSVKRQVAKAAAPSPEAEEREPRGARRRRETRSRLLEAALKLMAERGVEGVAINEITEAADVGFGSFYNHFESKEAIYAALVDGVFENFADALDRVTKGLPDPAEIISVSIRHTLKRARQEPVWGQFLIREGFSVRALNHGLGHRLMRDIQKGLAAKRFTVADPLACVISVGGTVLAAIALQLHLTLPASPAITSLGKLKFSEKHFAERIASTALQTLGLEHAEAEEITRRPLPAAEH